jgi:hypothetical protein
LRGSKLKRVIDAEKSFAAAAEDIALAGLGICLQFAARSARADAAGGPMVIRYLNDRGYVPPYEIADDLGFLNGKAFALSPKGIRRAGRKV